MKANLKFLGHNSLLFYTAVIFNRDNDWIPGRL